MLSRRNYRNIALNIAAMLAPMLAGVFVVPDLLQRLGPERFGVLSISWVLVGYFGVLDLGLARALTQYIAKLKGAGATLRVRHGVAVLVRRRLWGLGLVWVLLLSGLTPWLVRDVLGIPADLKNEALFGWVFLVLSIPALMWSSCSVGLLEANERFSALNAVRIPMGMAMFLMPWAVAYFFPNLGFVIGSIFVVRWVGALFLAMLCRGDFKDPDFSAARAHLPQITRFGGWLTLSNLVGPFLANFDRFAIAALLSVTAVTYYTVPFDVLARLPVLPLAMMGVLFPVLAASHASSDAVHGDAARVLDGAVQVLVTFWVPGMLLCGFWGGDFLQWWVGLEVAAQSLVVWHWIALGVLVNGFAHIPYALLHSVGRTDITAKIHMLELLPYLAGLWWAISEFGIAGAAAVWTLRVIVDTAILYGAVAKILPQLKRQSLHAILWAVTSSTLLSALLVWDHTVRNTPVSQGLLIAVSVGCAMLWSTWHVRKLLRNMA